VTGEPGNGRIGLALSGGGSRAMAFHLGCLRALNDLGLLVQVRAVSGVSGGAVLAGLYVFSDEDFESFDERVCGILRRGLQRRLALAWLRPDRLVRSLGTGVVAGSTAAAATVLRTGAGFLLGASGLRKAGRIDRVDHIQPPFRRWWSRTSAFERVLDAMYSGATLGSPTRGGVHAVINATDLGTQATFRFGTLESGASRLGRVQGNETIPVARAVAASAAFPPLLPALDIAMDFELGGRVNRRRAILTDGGVNENLGVECFDPRRDPRFSYNVLPVDVIVACDAGAGIPGGFQRPYWWAGRMAGVMESMMRQRRYATQRWLHDLADAGHVSGFLYAYLGQQDHRLPYLPADLVPRQAVVGYPTDFAPMSKSNLDLLAGRGEGLVRILFDHYAPSLG
jgi:NTE family protein